MNIIIEDGIKYKRPLKSDLVILFISFFELNFVPYDLTSPLGTAVDFEQASFYITREA
jgi:hypothetical protein